MIVLDVALAALVLAVSSAPLTTPAQWLGVVAGGLSATLTIGSMALAVVGATPHRLAWRLPLQFGVALSVLFLLFSLFPGIHSFIGYCALVIGVGGRAVVELWHPRKLDAPQERS